MNVIGAWFILIGLTAPLGAVDPLKLDSIDHHHFTDVLGECPERLPDFVP